MTSQTTPPACAADCGRTATTTILLSGVRTPVCLRHYNVWSTPAQGLVRSPAGEVHPYRSTCRYNGCLPFRGPR